MGTRNLTCVVLNGAYRVAQYCQWDGYPSGQGLTALNFLRTADLDLFRKQVDRCVFLSDKAVAATWKKCGADNSGWASTAIADKHKAKYPALSRDTGAKILQLIQDGTFEVHSDLEFAGDGLFCEWAYVVDLDAMTFEVHRGWFKDPNPTPSRFDYLDNPSEDYRPVRLVASWPLDQLPSETDFLSLDMETTE